METVSTPYFTESVLESAVYEIGTQYFRGAMSLDEAVKEIEKSVTIYMSE
jgi:hypothetical protein